MHYWVLKKREILRLANLKDKDDTENEYKKIYNGVTNDLWRREKLKH
jgi:hypothetical protein